MNPEAAIQSRGIAKGFGLGMAAVLLAYAVLYGWASMRGPEVRAEREGKLASRTIVIDRVLPINPPIEQLGEIQGPPKPAPKEAPVAETTPTPEVHAKEDPPKEIEGYTHAAEPVQPETKDLKKLPNGMHIAPVQGLYEDTAEGRLPVVRNDGLSPFKVYRKPFVQTGGKPVISIAVSDMGLSSKITESAIKSLPPEVTLIISPYADGPDMWTNEARMGGHEVWLSLPMESTTYPQDDPGPHTLLVGASERENQQKLDWIMSRAVGYAGLVATYKPEFMNAENDVRPVLGSIYKRGIGFIDSRNLPNSLPETMAFSMNAPFSSIDVWIDKPENTPEIINASLQQLELIAKENGYAAGIISPSSISFREIQSWITTLKDKGFVLAPLSAQTGY